MKKSFLLVIICVFSVGLAFSQGVPYVGEWKPFNDSPDGGSSTVTMTTGTKDGMTTYRFTGNVTTQYVYGYTGWEIDPNPATLANLKTAKSISFKCIGDGKRYTIKYKMDTITDWAHHEFSFNTEAGKEVIIDVPIRMFFQPAWGKTVRMDQSKVFNISWQTHEVWRKDKEAVPYDITIWDVRIMQ
jgi:hypothetical protein